uniref:Putative secreted protein n=1 Tax=Anopheles marajoara TaxID=58244 RepID=A0A2M4CD11_9DIPT
MLRNIVIGLLRALCLIAAAHAEMNGEFGVVLRPTVQHCSPSAKWLCVSEKLCGKRRALRGRGWMDGIAMGHQSCL